MWTYMRQFDLIQWAIFVVNGDAFHSIQSRVSTIDDLAKYGVFPVKMRLLGVSDKELGFIGVRT